MARTALLLFCVGPPRVDTVRGPRLCFRNVGPFLDLCHRPVHTHILPLSTDLVTGQQQDRGQREVVCHFFAQTVTVKQDSVSLIS